MPKSRQRKDHKKKSEARTRKNVSLRRKYENEMQNMMMEQVEKMRQAQSGTTENGPVQQTA
jgi:hypothetical protein